MILLITAAHVVVESDLSSTTFLDRLSPTIQQIPVALYAVPVTYAGFIYGFEGGVLTGLWIALLASVNIPISHRGDFEWLTELIFILVVVGIGIVLSVPVERERRQRHQAEETTRQLRMLNDVVHASIGPWDPERTARSALVKLANVLDVSGACLGLWKRDRQEPVVTASHAGDPSLARELESRVAEKHAASGRISATRGGGFLHTSLATEGLTGGLCVAFAPGKVLSTGQLDFLQAVGSQLAVGIENALLRQQEHESLESYLRLVTQTQEEERKHVARELHDSAAQQLALLCRGLEELGASARPSDGPELERLRELAASTLGEIRQFSRDLRPTLLDDLGLVPALEWLVTDIADRMRSQAKLTVEGAVRRLPPEVEVALYRISQEALRNVERHAGSTRLTVAVRFDPERILVSVEDDGCGFEVPANLGTLVSTGRLGIMGMRERAQLAGGTLTLASGPANGTVVTIDVPA